MDTNDIQLARLDERLKILIEQMSADKEEKSAILKWMQDTDTKLQKITNELENLKQTFSTAEPTISSFVKINNQVEGAGKLGKYLWLALGVLLGSIGYIKEFIHRMVV